MPTPSGQQPTKGGYYGYSHGDSVRVSLCGSGVPTVREVYLGFRTLLRAREPVRARVVRVRVRWVPQRVRCAYGFDGPADMLSQDLGFRTFRNHREKVTRPCSS